MKSRLAKAFQLPFLPLWLAPLILVSPVLLTGKALFWGTPYLQFVPWRVLAWESIRNGQLPLWNPYNGMGAPLLANYQSALLYPPNWILLVFQAIGGTGLQAWGQALLVYVHWVWAGLGMALLLRLYRVQPLGQSVGGLAYALSAYLVARASFLSMNAVLAWIPWVVLFTSRIAGPDQRSDLKQRGLFEQVVPLAISLAFMLLAGHAQLSWYTIIFATIWLEFWSWKRGGWQDVVASTAKFSIAGVIAIGIAAIQLIPTAEYLLQSQRATAVDYQYAANYSFWPWHLLTLVVPWFFGTPASGDYWYAAYYWEDAIYIGLLPLILAIAASISLLKKRAPTWIDGPSASSLRRTIILFLIMLPVVILIALGSFTPIYPFLYRYLPTFSMFQAPTRWMILVVLALSILAGIGVQLWHRPEKRGLYWTRLATAGAVAVMVGAVIAWIFMGGITPTFIKATALAGIFGVGIGSLTLLAPTKDTPKRSISFWEWGVVSLVAIDLIVVNWGMNPGIPLSFYQQPPTPKQNLAQLTDGHRVYISKSDEEAIKYDRYFQVKTFTPAYAWVEFKSDILANANIYSGIRSANNYDPLVPGIYANWQTVLDKATEGQKVAMLQWMDVGALAVSDRSSPTGMRWEAINGASRLRWAGCADMAVTQEDAWRKFSTLLSSSSVPIVTNTIVLEGIGSESTNLCQTDSSTKLVIIEENTEELIIDVQANQGGWLVLSDMWYPGWRVLVDGISTPLLRANTVFRSVAVPSGTHTVSLKYQPLSFTLGAIITSFSIISLTGWSILQKRRRVSKSRIS